jgi:hypothetical protein
MLSVLGGVEAERKLRAIDLLGHFPDIESKIQNRIAPFLVDTCSCIVFECQPPTVHVITY